MKTFDEDFPPLTTKATQVRTDGLAKLREPFPAHQISKLPKPTKKQTEDVKDNFKLGTRCAICGAWHHPDVIHLDYVGHAALTDRLLDADPAWYWEPLSIADGVPVRDAAGGMWIKLTVCGVTRLGYGHAGDKTGGDAIKEIIGDALRNAAMRFGAALELWHKGDLHIDPPAEQVRDEEDNPETPSHEWMLNLAKEAISLFKDGEVERASNHVYSSFTDSQGVNNDQLERFWFYLDEESAMRSAIRAYRAICHAQDLAALDKVWARVPKHSIKILTPALDTRKQELLMKAAA